VIEDKMTMRRYPPRAIELLRRVVAHALFSREALARQLVITEEQLAEYLDERTAMPLDRQLCLAQVAIEQMPLLARAGYRLRGQVGAALAFNEKRTVSHRYPPPSNHL
jgi:hypothetical protein